VRTEAPDLPDPIPTKFSLGIFHYNVQYVAGGGDHLVDLVITESIAPIVELFERHPGWGIDLEMSGEALEAMAARHPDTFARLKALGDSGQIDVVAPLYQEQLWILFPRRSMERSFEIQSDNLRALDLRIAPVTFFQEGAWGEGILPFLDARCMGPTVLPRNQHRYQYGEPAQEPWFERGGYPVVVGPGNIGPGHPSGIEVRWNYLDDGELLPTGGLNPYFEPLFRRNDASIAEYETELQAMEDAGFWITTISKYAAALDALGVARAPLPQVTDGTWQPQSTLGAWRWMGGAGLFFFVEIDNVVNTARYAARNLLVAAETMLDAARAAGQDTAAEAATVREGWRNQVLGEISDATGINPIPVEAEYGLNHAAEASRLAGEAVDALKAKLGLGVAEIDAFEGTVREAPPPPAPGPEVAAPIPVETDPGGRSEEIVWRKVSDAPETYDLAIAFGTSLLQSNELSVTFHRAGDSIWYSPALLEETVQEVRVPDFVYEYGANWLPLANGLLGLGDDWWVVKDNSTMHLAVTYFLDSDAVAFLNQTANERAPQTWRFRVLRGTAEEAIEAANRLNTFPTVVR
ncbi:MAG: hypothetical protein K8I02_05515, partial [Candidatus Methylomirabilis sp.]|nr:hypothetical protein [Deltaproteobacteria bacterium]